MNLIVAIDNDFGIGKDNHLLVSLPEDLDYFKRNTMNKVCIMGKNTYESLPKKPLKNRITLVLCDDENYKIDFDNTWNTKVFLFNNLSDMDEFILDSNIKSENIFVCGGASIYNLFMDRCDTFYITNIFYKFEADTFLPRLKDKLENGNFDCKESELHYDKGYIFNFEIYKTNSGI